MQIDYWLVDAASYEARRFGRTWIKGRIYRTAERQLVAYVTSHSGFGWRPSDKKSSEGSAAPPPEDLTRLKGERDALAARVLELEAQLKQAKATAAPVAEDKPKPETKAKPARRRKRATKRASAAKG